MIAFKVVDKNKKSYIKALKLKGEQDKKYILEYKVGKITTAPKDSLGISLFNNLATARQYKHIYCQENARIFIVKTIGKRIRRKFMANSCYYAKFYKYKLWKKRKNVAIIWDNTILYPAIEVLEEIEINF